MCDNVTTVDVQETRCELCLDRIVCLQSGCRWYPDIYVDSWNEQCFDGNKDFRATVVGGLLLTVSFCFISWVLGWCIKDSGKLASIRRYGIVVPANVLERWSTVNQSRTMEGYPINMQTFWALVEFERPATKTQWRWMDLKKWPPIAEAVPPPPPLPPGTEDLETLERWRDAACRVWDDDFEEDTLMLCNDPVALEVKCSRTVWEETIEGDSIRIIYDPMDPQGSVMPVAATMHGQIMNKLVLCVVGATISIALAGGGVMILRAAHHCGSKPDCCLQPGEQCEGIGGKTHAMICGPYCSTQWVMWAMMGGMFGFMSSIILLLFRQMGAFPSHTFIGRIFDAMCGQGEFCAPDEPKNRGMALF
eukprot:COSAG02_NODE_284_length_25691_cov_14.733354_8_plen_362_part_00